MAKVLDGVRVLDLGRVLVGPITGMLLADLGAEVVKIEHPEGGDQFRSYAAGFNAVNMNKRSVCIDLRSALGKEALLRLVEGRRRAGGELPPRRHGTSGAWGRKRCTPATHA